MKICLSETGLVFSPSKEQTTDRLWLYEALRSEVQAHQQIRQASLMNGLSQRWSVLHPDVPFPREDVESCITALQQNKDIFCKPGNQLCASPLRLVEAGNRYLLFSSLSNRQLQLIAGVIPVEQGVWRYLATHTQKDWLAQLEASLSPRIFSLEQWCGLDLVGAAGDGFLESLHWRWRKRLKDKDLPGAAEVFCLSSEGGRFRPEPIAPETPTPLWRANVRDHWQYYWCEQKNKALRISVQDQLRAELSLRATHFSLEAAYQQQAGGIRLELNHFIPLQEYHFIRLLSNDFETTEPRLYYDKDNFENVKHILWTRLGIRCVERA